MLKKFFLGSMLAQSFIDTRSGPERLAASGWATATTPEELIAAHIIQEFAKNPNSWTCTGKFPTNLVERRSDNRNPVVPSYERPNKTRWYRGITPVFTMTRDHVMLSAAAYYRNADGDGAAPWFEKNCLEVSCTDTKDPAIILADDLALQLFLSIQAIFVQKAKAEEAAAQAQKDMEENERKWNLAERLLGMKRNEHGALVPAVTLEE